MKHSTYIICICFGNPFIEKKSKNFVGILLCKVGAELGSVTWCNSGNMMIVQKLKIYRPLINNRICVSESVQWFMWWKCSACALDFSSLLYSFLQLCFIHFVSFRLGACLRICFTLPNNVRFFITACVEQVLAITEFSYFIVYAIGC